ncbi:MAG: PH domain-containing protein [Candidatus Hodarchaeota archaeon]
MNDKKMLEKNFQEQRIDKSLIAKEVLKWSIGIIIISGLAYLIVFGGILSASLDSENATIPMNDFILLNIYLMLFICVIPTITIVLIVRTYMGKFIETFKFKLTNSHLEIKHSVLTKHRVTIPYSRIQNINIVNGVFDRIFNIYTVIVETAGKSGMGAHGQQMGKPEGYIPGLKDPFKFETQLKQILDKYNVFPSGLEDKIFKPQELAFDNFISYILSKMRDRDDLLKTNIKELRENKNITSKDLAAKIGVKSETIELLEAGRYTPSLSLAYKIARELNCKIEDLFLFE